MLTACSLPAGLSTLLPLSLNWLLCVTQVSGIIQLCSSVSGFSHLVWCAQCSSVLCLVLAVLALRLSVSPLHVCLTCCLSVHPLGHLSCFSLSQVMLLWTWMHSKIFTHLCFQFYFCFETICFIMYCFFLFERHRVLQSQSQRVITCVLVSSPDAYNRWNGARLKGGTLN